jgi:hypothetical protein
MLTKVINPIIESIIRGVISRPLGATASAVFSAFTSNAFTRTTAQTATQTLTIKDAQDVAIQNSALTFAAWRADVEIDDSLVSTDVSVVDIDGVSVVTVFITLYSDLPDQFDFITQSFRPVPLAGYLATDITIAVSGTGNTISQPSVNTDANGSTSASFVTTVAESKSITVTVATPYGNRVLTTSPVVIAGGTIDPPAPGDPFFEDDFVGTVRNDSGGFTWSSTSSRTTVQSFDGHNALRFRFGPDADLGDSQAQQGFNMGRNLTELWIQYYLWVPSNYVHRAQSSGGVNNKFLRLWGDDYNATNKVGASLFRESPSYLRYEATNNAWGAGVGEVVGSGSPNKATFGAAPMLGVWTKVQLRYKIVSALDADDAEFDVWFDDVKVIEQTAIPQQYTTGQNYWNNGYLMGWANSGYLAETDFYIRNIKFYDTDPGWT